MVYKVTRPIRDLEDEEFFYDEGAIYPREGLEPSKERIQALLDKRCIVADEAVKPKRRVKKTED